MKKLLLLFASGLMMSSLANAQTHADLSMNMVTLSGNGFSYDFMGDGGNNCIGQHVGAWGGVTGQTWTIDQTTNSLQVVTDGSQGTTGTQIMQFYTGDCNLTTIDLSTAANQKLRLKVNASIAVPELLVVMYGASNSTSNLSGTPNTIPLAAGDNDITVNLNLGGIADAASVQSIGLVPRNAWDDANIAVTLKFDLVQIGDGITTTTSTNKAQLMNNAVSVYPNPAKDQISVNLKDMNVKGTFKFTEI